MIPTVATLCLSRVCTCPVEEGLEGTLPSVLALRWPFLGQPEASDYSTVVLMDIGATSQTDQETKVTLGFEQGDQALSTNLGKAPPLHLLVEGIKDLTCQFTKGQDFFHANNPIAWALKPENILARSGGSGGLTLQNLQLQDGAYTCGAALVCDLCTAPVAKCYVG